MRLLLDERGDRAVVLQTQIRILDEINRDERNDVRQSEDANLRRLGAAVLGPRKVVRKQRLGGEIVEQLQDQDQIERVGVVLGRVERDAVRVVFHVDADHREAALVHGRPDGLFRGRVADVGHNFAHQLQDELDDCLKVKENVNLKKIYNSNKPKL